MLDFQIVNEPQNRVHSSEKCDFQIVNEPQNRVLSTEMLNFEENLLRAAKHETFFKTVHQKLQMVVFEIGFFARSRHFRL